MHASIETTQSTYYTPVPNSTNEPIQAIDTELATGLGPLASGSTWTL